MIGGKFRVTSGIKRGNGMVEMVRKMLITMLRMVKKMLIMTVECGEENVDNDC